MLTKNQILNFLKENKTYFKERFHLTKIGLIGSFATDTATEKSDVDLIIEFEPGTQNLFGIEYDLREYVKKKFDKSVDFCHAKYIKPYAKEIILKQAIYV